MQKSLEYYIQKIAPQAKSGKYFQIWFFPRFGGKNGGVLSMRMQVSLDSSFARPGSAPIWGGKKVEFRDWTKSNSAPPLCGRSHPMQGCSCFFFFFFFFFHAMVDLSDRLLAGNISLGFFERSLYITKAVRRSLALSPAPALISISVFSPLKRGRGALATIIRHFVESLSALI